MDLKGFLTSMMLIIIGALLLSQNYPPSLEFMQLIGWIPLVFGLLWIGVAIKKEIVH